MKRKKTGEANVDKVEKARSVNVVGLQTNVEFREALWVVELVMVETTVLLRVETTVMATVDDQAANQSDEEEEVLTGVRRHQEEIRAQVLTAGVEINVAVRRSSHRIDG
jgi:hypothetical protein